MRYDTGDNYEGEWKDGKRHGKGKMKYANNVIFTGSWSKDVREGPGEIVFPTSVKIAGGFHSDSPKDIHCVTYSNKRSKRVYFHHKVSASGQRVSVCRWVTDIEDSKKVISLKPSKNQGSNKML